MTHGFIFYFSLIVSKIQLGYFSLLFSSFSPSQVPSLTLPLSYIPILIFQNDELMPDFIDEIYDKILNKLKQN